MEIVVGVVAAAGSGVDVAAAVGTGVDVAVAVGTGVGIATGVSGWPGVKAGAGDGVGNAVGARIAAVVGAKVGVGAAVAHAARRKADDGEYPEPGADKTGPGYRIKRLEQHQHRQARLLPPVIRTLRGWDSGKYRTVSRARQSASGPLDRPSSLIPGNFPRFLYV